MAISCTDSFTHTLTHAHFPGSWKGTNDMALKMPGFTSCFIVSFSNLLITASFIRRLEYAPINQPAWRELICKGVKAYRILKTSFSKQKGTRRGNPRRERKSKAPLQFARKTRPPPSKYPVLLERKEEATPSAPSKEKRDAIPGARKTRGAPYITYKSGRH